MDLLEAGIYTVSDASKLLGVSNQKVNGWVFGYQNTHSAPIAPSQLDKIDGQKAMTFVNLMEARFIAAFAKHGVSVRAMRLMAEEAKRFLNVPHPFATDMLFKTDGRKIFIEVAESAEDKALYDLGGKNWAFHNILAEGLKDEVLYGPSGYAMAWAPRRGVAPNVLVDPRKAFGQPVLKDSGVPTRALFDAFNAEDETYESVAHWYDVPVEQVKEAVKFEFDLARAA